MKIIDELTPLNNEELKTINGGESGWYWLIYAVGNFAREGMYQDLDMPLIG